MSEKAAFVRGKLVQLDSTNKKLRRCSNTPERDTERLELSMPSKHSTRVSPEKRFLAKVEKTAGCWLWSGSLTSGGYGRLSVRGKLILAHRYSYELAHGAIPDGLVLCHQCDVRNCVNPDHLFPGTHNENMQDMAAKGRAASGMRGDWINLTIEEAREIRALHAAGHSTRDLARRFRITQMSIVTVLSGRVLRDDVPDA